MWQNSARGCAPYLKCSSVMRDLEFAGCLGQYCCIAKLSSNHTNLFLCGCPLLIARTIIRRSPAATLLWLHSRCQSHLQQVSTTFITARGALPRSLATVHVPCEGVADSSTEGARCVAVCKGCAWTQSRTISLKPDYLSADFSSQHLTATPQSYKRHNNSGSAHNSMHRQIRLTLADLQYDNLPTCRGVKRASALCARTRSVKSFCALGLYLQSRCYPTRLGWCMY